MVSTNLLKVFLQALRRETLAFLLMVRFIMPCYLSMLHGNASGRVLTLCVEKSTTFIFDCSPSET